LVTVEIVEATPDHIEAILEMVRPEDREELWASTMHTPRQAIEAGVRNSDKTMVGLADGVPVCIWGVVNDSIIGPIGSPWLVATTALDKYARQFVRHCKAEAVKIFDGYAVLENHVHAKNTKAIQWLKWLGFSVSEDSEEYGMLRQPFYKFSMRCENV
jgi:hypothetical protein